MRSGGEPVTATALSGASLASMLIPAVIGAAGLGMSAYGMAQDAPDPAKPNLPSPDVGSMGMNNRAPKFGSPGGRMQTQQNRSNTALAMLG